MIMALNTITHWLMRLCQALVIICLCLIVGSLSLNVILRFLFSISLTGADSFAQVSMVWLAMIAMPLGLYLSEHVAFDLIRSIVPRRLKTALRITVLALILSTCLILIYYCGPFLSAGFRQTFPAIQWMSKGYAYVAVPIGLALTAWVACVDILNSATGNAKNRHFALHIAGGGGVSEAK